MPTVIDIRLPPQQTTLRLSLGNVQINRPLPNPEQLWAMPTGDGRMPIDLCNPNQALPAGAQPPAISTGYGSRYPTRPAARW
jgi:hypothetical protein